MGTKRSGSTTRIWQRTTTVRGSLMRQAEWGRSQLAVRLLLNTGATASGLALRRQRPRPCAARPDPAGRPRTRGSVGRSRSTATRPATRYNRSELDDGVGRHWARRGRSGSSPCASGRLPRQPAGANRGNRREGLVAGITSMYSRRGHVWVRLVTDRKHRCQEPRVPDDLGASRWQTRLRSSP